MDPFPKCSVCIVKNFATAHHTHHVLKVPSSLEKHKRIFPLAYLQWFLKLYNSSKEKLGSEKRVADDNAIIVSDLHSKAVFSLKSSKKSSWQKTIQTGMDHTLQSDICHTNNIILEMTIADSFHCKNVPDMVVESTRFKQLLEKATYVGSNFKIPHRKKI